MQVDVKTDVKKIVKDRAFDLVGAGLIIAVGMICLGAVELRNITFKEAGTYQFVVTEIEISSGR